MASWSVAQVKGGPEGGNGWMEREGGRRGQESTSGAKKIGRKQAKEVR